MDTQGDTKRPVLTSIRLSQEEHAALKALAESQQRSVSGQLRWLIAQLVEEQAA